MRSIKALDRELQDWYGRIEKGMIKLPRFQRFEAWDRRRITSLLNTVINNLPLGITLVLEVDKEQFISRYIKTAEQKEPYPRVIEHLLDGQQRLTALWRVLHDNYKNETFFLYNRNIDEIWSPNGYNSNSDDVEIYCQSRWINKNGNRMPMWADDPKECLKRGCIPVSLFKPIDIKGEIDKWIADAVSYKKPKLGSDNYEKEFEAYHDFKKEISDLIIQSREIVKHYNLPYLALPTDTSKDTALDVFINMNTNSKPLSQYDIIVAEIEGVKDTSLHDLQEEVNRAYPDIENYFDLSYLILYTSALMQEKLPNKKGIWEMQKELVIEDWDKMVYGLSKMADFLKSQKLFDKQRLPTNAVLAVIASLFTDVPETGDQTGQAVVLLKKYLWSSFFTDRYENSAAGRAYADYMALKNVLLNKQKEDGGKYEETDVPVLNRSRYPLATIEQLIEVGWPKNENIRGRGILAVANYFGAHDFADGSEITASNILNRHYHHIFPDALINEAMEYYPEQIRSFLALNCSLITDTTNLKIGRKEPLTYLKDRYQWTDETIIEQRLSSHLIPINELSAGDYEGYEDQVKAKKIKKDYEQFLMKRAQMILWAVERLVAGETVYASQVFENCKEDINTVNS